MWMPHIFSLWIVFYFNPHHYRSFKNKICHSHSLPYLYTILPTNYYILIWVFFIPPGVPSCIGKLIEDCSLFPVLFID